MKSMAWQVFSDYVIELISSDVPYQVYNNQKNRDDADLIDLSAESKTDIDFHVEPASIKLSGAIAFSNRQCQPVCLDRCAG
jgi:hypothetical protein